MNEPTNSLSITLLYTQRNANGTNMGTDGALYLSLTPLPCSFYSSADRETLLHLSKCVLMRK